MAFDREVLRERIARELTRIDGDHPKTAADITHEFVVQDRKKRFYPTAVYDIDSAKGGYESSHLAVISIDSFERADKELELLISKV